MTVIQYKAFKRFHKRSVRLSMWLADNEFYSPLIALLGAVFFVAWIWS